MWHQDRVQAVPMCPTSVIPKKLIKHLLYKYIFFVLRCSYSFLVHGVPWRVFETTKFYEVWMSASILTPHLEGHTMSLFGTSLKTCPTLVPLPVARLPQHNLPVHWCMQAPSPSYVCFEKVEVPSRQIWKYYTQTCCHTVVDITCNSLTCTSHWWGFYFRLDMYVKPQDFHWI